MADRFEAAWSGVGIGGAIALDFANTLDWRLRAAPVELLTSYAELLRWARSAGVLTRDEAELLRSWSEAHPRAAGAALAAAVRLREAIVRLLAALQRGEALPASALGQLEATCIAAWAGRHLQMVADELRWTWRGRTPAPARPAWAVALDAAHLLTSAERTRVRQCSDAECGWYFLDSSRNRSRRWCSMEACGNRNKARRFSRRASGRPARGA